MVEGEVELVEHLQLMERKVEQHYRWELLDPQLQLLLVVEEEYMVAVVVEKKEKLEILVPVVLVLTIKLSKVDVDVLDVREDGKI